MQSVFPESLRQDVNNLGVWKQRWVCLQLGVLGDVYHDFDLNICQTIF